MEENSFEQYVKDVKAWADDVQLMMKEMEMDNEVYEQWNEEMEKFIGDLEGKLNQQDQTEITIEEAEEVENRAKELYSRSKELTLENNSDSHVRQKWNQQVPIGGHQLPPLPYNYNALEPYISEEIMRLHHDEHHKSYVEGLNKAEKMMALAREKNDFDLLKHWEREAAFHGSGHYLHTIFWDNMKPKGGGKPSGALLNQIKQDFGSFEAFKKHFTESAKKVEGVGWAILVWAPRAHRLEILQSEKHQLFTQWDTIPLLVLDVWEHAYYLQYKNERADYVKNWWNIVNWKDVQHRFLEARKLKWKPY